MYMSIIFCLLCHFIATYICIVFTSILKILIGFRAAIQCFPSFEWAVLKVHLVFVLEWA